MNSENENTLAEIVAPWKMERATLPVVCSFTATPEAVEIGGSVTVATAEPGVRRLSPHRRTLAGRHGAPSSGCGFVDARAGRFIDFRVDEVLSSDNRSRVAYRSVA
jgi:hypothetical protein